MPPRHTYWTILFGNQPTAFRSAEREELLPTFKQIQAKHPDAVMMWFARGRLWKSPEEARDTFDRPRGDSPKTPASARWPDRAGRGEASPKPRSGEGGDWRNKPQGDRPRGPKPEWQNRGPKPPASARRPERPGYGEAAPKPRSGEGGEWRERPQSDRPPGPPKPRSGEGGKPAWQDRGPRGPRPEWKDSPQGPRPPGSAHWPNKAGYGEASPKPRSGEGGPWQNRDDRPQGERPRGPRPEWKDRPQADRPFGPPKPRSNEGGKPAWQNPGAKPPASARRPDKASYGEAAPKSRSGEGGDWRDKPQGDRPRGPRPEWQDRSQGDRPRGPRPEWKDRPKGDRPPGPPKPRSGEGGAWQNRGPKPQWRDKPQGDRPPRPRDTPTGDRPAFKDPDKRGRDWRPGGAHKDPRDRFKVPRDVKRARFKQNLQRDRTNPRPPRKKKDEE